MEFPRKDSGVTLKNPAPLCGVFYFPDAASLRHGTSGAYPPSRRIMFVHEFYVIRRLPVLRSEILPTSRAIRSSFRRPDRRVHLKKHPGIFVAGR